MELKENEVLDDLQLNGLMIIQNKLKYRFGFDSVLLANYVKAKKSDIIAEFCAGSGVISILINEKCHPKEIIGFEVLEDFCEMANRSLQYNNIENISFVNDKLENSKNYLKNKKMDIVVCNPPYYEVCENGNINDKYLKMKYEINTNLENVFKSAGQILKYRGKLFLTFVPERLDDLILNASIYKFRLKNLKIIFSNEKSKLLLCEFVLNGNKGCVISK